MGNVYTNDTQILLQKLLLIYEPISTDWLSYQITKKNTLTIHHVIKIADGGILCVDNAALLTKRSHRLLHMCEHTDFILYSEINDFFMEVIVRGTPLNDFYMKESNENKKALCRTIYK